MVLGKILLELCRVFAYQHQASYKDEQQISYKFYICKIIIT